KQINQVYSDQYKVSYNVKKLIDERNRVWASPNITFVAKCIAAIEMLSPDYLICGGKHEFISDCFTDILSKLNIKIRSFKFEDFKDLRLTEAMDRTDSIYSLVEINDNYDLIQQKLFLTKDTALRNAWLEHFINLIFAGAPERLKTNIGQIQRTAPEKENMLNKFLANVRFLIPYHMNTVEQAEIGIEWSDQILNKITDYHKVRMERIIKSLYKGQSYTHVIVQRVFTSGKSGSYVFEVWEYENHQMDVISNVSILKIGAYEDLADEYHNYIEMVKNRRTFAFMEITAKSYLIENYVGLLYQDAKHNLGIGRQERLNTILKIFQERPIPTQDIINKIHKLFDDHLNETLYKHGTYVDRGTIRRYYNELLPSEYKVEVDVFDKEKNTLTIKTDDGRHTFYTGDVLLTEVNLRDKNVRAYSIDSAHTKIDLIFNNDELLLNSLVKDRKLKLNGVIRSDRRSYYDELFKKIGVKRVKGKLSLNDSINVTDTIERLNEILSIEHLDFQISAVHGDLHCENVLYGEQNFGIIDYGKMRSRFVSVYDIAYLFADIKLKELAMKYELEELVRFETALDKNNFLWFRKLFMPELNTFEIFEYGQLPSQIQNKCSPKLFYAALTLTYLGMLKFDLEPNLKKAALLFAHFSYLRIK
uniref:hypothetical protein n=1 Tax=uncultured Mucilaginibacter sp. TaxID=797541 RepID=UPI0025E61EB8